MKILNVILWVCRKLQYSAAKAFNSVTHSTPLTENIKSSCSRDLRSRKKEINFKTKLGLASFMTRVLHYVSKKKR